MLEIEVQDAQVTRERLNRELWRLTEEIRATQQQIVQTDSSLAKLEAEHQAKVSALALKLQQLRAMEEDLAAARQREAVVKKVLAEVVALEKKAAVKDKLLADLKARNAALDKQLQERGTALQASEDRVQKLLKSLVERQAALDKLAPKLEAALEASKALEAEAGKTPPPSKQPARKEPPKKEAPKKAQD